MTMTQKELLINARQQLDLTWSAFAVRIGASDAALLKWKLSPDSGSYREMPQTVRLFVEEILAHEALKNECKQLTNKKTK